MRTRARFRPAVESMESRKVPSAISPAPDDPGALVELHEEPGQVGVALPDEFNHNPAAPPIAPQAAIIGVRI